MNDLNDPNADFAPGEVSLPDLEGRKLPVIPMRSNMVLPGSVSPILLGRPFTLRAMETSELEEEGLVILVLQKSADTEEVKEENLYQVGICARIQSLTMLPNGVSKAMVESFAVVDIEDFFWSEDHWKAEIFAREMMVPSSEKELRGRMKQVLKSFKDYVAMAREIPDDLLLTLNPDDNPFLFYFGMLAFIDAPPNTLQEVVEARSIDEMSSLILDLIESSVQTGRMREKISNEVRRKMQQNQKEYMLQEELRMIREELGDSARGEHPEIQRLAAELEKREFSEETRTHLDEELDRLSQLHPSSPEYSSVRTYLDWFLHLPYGTYTEDCLDLPKVRRFLNRNHYGLEKVKDRILEHTAVLKLTQDKSTPILCLSGPPGVGKTTLARSIAQALGRKYVRISLGGVRDESEIRGHRRTYIGSMPGRIVQALRRAKSMNPLILLDEIDKMSGDFRGDPASALLEVLDAEQNHEFRDHFLEVGLDLSRVLFIATANMEEHIPEPLRDRLEIVRLSGYYSFEKVQIARKHILPKLCERNGLKLKTDLDISDPLIGKLISEYTREAGVRDLERHLDSLCRKRAMDLVSKKKFNPTLEDKDLHKYLGAVSHSRNRLFEGSRPGLITGLAWTPVGGEILQLECTLLSGRGKLSLTGTLGDVMKESAHLALTLVRERLKDFDLDPELVRKTDVHIHVPEGAIPKDGPSAGVGLTLALLSAFVRQAISTSIAFTGEISLTGQVRAVGGIPEKIIAAREAGVKKVYLPAENRRHLEELPAKARKGVQFHYVSHLDDVVKALFKKPAKTARARKSSPKQVTTQTPNAII